ncbi:hypothetical protein NDU88_006023 [Pleurodeles waltl]|uniref:Uncharacterized protein n=1 Tax=Pleurodeles waltl TaxID=8319 RepID=A0AAV7RNE6_PLEWA|nr:hypothetical protein NDU88_006023 [Pleurodeles waltl]
MGSRAPPPVAGSPRGPIQRSDPPAPPVSRGAETTGHRSPPSPASDCVRREPLRRAPPLRRQSPAIGTARLQPRSAAIQLLLRSRVAPGAGTHRSC